MSLLVITVQPLGTESHFDTSVLLDGNRYTFAFYTNTADRAWYMDVQNDDGSSVVKGIALSNGARR